MAQDGETTVLNLCGFCLPREIELVIDHPLRILVGTSHLLSSFKAAQLVDGGGLSEDHYRCSAEGRLREGVTVIGEIGAGRTLGGGGQDFILIPRTIEHMTGRLITPDQARELKWAVLGKNLRLDNFDAEKTEECLRILGLRDRLTAQDAKKAIGGLLLPPLQDALRGFEEAAVLSSATGSPAVLHTSPFSVSEIVRLAKKYPKARLIAAHCNQGDFETKDAIYWCKILRDLECL